MTRPDGSVRRARVRLGLALLEAGSTTGEGAEQLRRALTEPGEEPPEAEIRVALARAAEQAGDQATALRELVAAIGCSGPETADEPAADAMRVLEAGGPRLARELAEQDVTAVFERAQADAASTVLVKLAALIAHQRGDDEMTGRLLQAPAEGDDDPAMQAARTVARAHERLDAGDPLAALALTQASGSIGAGGNGQTPAADPALVAVRALSQYAAGDAAGALATLEGAPASYEGVVVRALAWLAEAAAAEGDDRQSAVTEAVESASQAARLEPSAGDALLLRAQALLEGSMDLEEGRRLLRSGLRRLEGDPGKVRWWRVQDGVRTDERYRYLTVEVSAAADRHDEVVRRAEEMTGEGLALLQLAATDELAAGSLLALGRGEEAARRAASASERFRLANDLPRAVGTGRLAVESGGVSVGLASSLASLLWQSSVVGATSESPAELVEEGLRLLDRAEALLDGTTAAEACYTRGLLLVRRIELAPRTATQRRWEPLPWLQARCLAEPEAYPSVHLSWAFNNALLNRAALHFAEQAFALAPSDPWAQEVVVANRFNWWAELDDATRGLLAELPDDAWRETVDAFDCLVAGDEARLCPKVDRLDAVGPWALNVRAHAMARCGDLAGAREAFQRLVDEQDSYLSASDAAALVGDLDRARRLVAEGEAAGAVSGEQAALALAFVDLLEGGGDDPLGTVTAHVERMRRPFEIATMARVLCPTLRLLHGDRPGLPAALAAIQAAAEARLRDLPHEQPLTADFDGPLEKPDDEALVGLVRGLLAVEAHLAAGDGEAAASLVEQLLGPERRALALLVPVIAGRARASAGAP